MSGNLSGFQMQMARMARVTFIPLSSATGVLSDAIDTAQKDIEGHMHEYLMNRIPIAKSFLPNQVDIWTNQPLNVVNSPWRKIALAFSPIKVSDGPEWWRKTLFDIKYSGLSKLNKDSTGSYEYSSRERELINKLIAEQEPVKELKKILNRKAYKQQIENFKAHRSQNWFNKNKRIELDNSLLPIHAEIDAMLNRMQQIAEARMVEMNPDIANTILQQRITDEQMKRGDIEGAVSTQDRHLQQTQTLLQMSK